MTAASGMKAQQLEVDTIANNIANVNTTGFKKSDVSFRDMLYQTFREPGSLTAVNSMTPTGLQIGSGTEVAGTAKLFRQGEMVPTGSPFDMAISGEGFFRVLLPNGDFRYTRDGSFRLDGNGNVVNADGHLLDPAVSVPQDAIEVIIGVDGTLSVLTDPGQPPTPVTNVSVFRFPNPTGLKAQGGNLYSETPSSGNVFAANPGLDGTGTIRQGFLERSNVAIVDELVGLILAQRNYEINSRAISVSDEMLQQVNQLIR